MQDQVQEEIISLTLVVSGLPERHDKDDTEAVLDVIHAVSSVPLLPANIKSLTRLGSAANSTGNPRLLRFVIKSPHKHMRNDIIIKALSLRNSTDPLLKTIYINADKSKAVLKAEYDTRCELRRRIAASETNFVIKVGKIVIKNQSGTSEKAANQMGN